MSKTDMNRSREIALWGPSGSGKTWLMYSLGRALYGLRDPEFAYTLQDSSATVVRPVDVFTPPPQGGTQKPKDEIWIYQRRPRVSKYSARHILSAHSHVINLHDLKGEETIRLRDRITTETLSDSEYILLMLDHTLVMSPQDEALAGGTSLGLAQPEFTQNQYAGLVRDLFDVLLYSPNVENRRVAVCFTKIDLLNVRKRPPGQLIEAYFGRHMVELLNNYKEQNQWEIEAFCVSAAGYLPGRDNAPNYDVRTLNLRNPDQWEPYNVQSPFFWLFEDIERRRVRNSGSPVLRFFFAGREKSYMKYPISYS